LSSSSQLNPPFIPVDTKPSKACADGEVVPKIVPISMGRFATTIEPARFGVIAPAVRLPATDWFPVAVAVRPSGAAGSQPVSS
jgi:hypothetical protein